ncbi:MAG TPA: response regulator transcription factor [Candidatus Angelobacter sp.]|jgi:DNA-binding NarL/FixJ family response regulator|nr:response regulator transcription factor [Candidatus Angelobacter sp.]
MLRILVADDHEVVRKGLIAVLAQRPDWQVCAEATDGREAVRLAAKLQPQVAILDLSMPSLNGLEATRQIRREVPQTEILVFSMYEDEQFVHDLLSAGARGYLLKSDVAGQLVTAVETVARHKPYFTSEIAERVVEGFLRVNTTKQAESEAGVLTGREREIVQLLAESKSNKEIAEVLSISVKTVQTHRATIMRKLGIGSIVDLVHYAIRNRLVAP